MRNKLLAAIAAALLLAVAGCNHAPSPDDPSSKATAMKSLPNAAGGPSATGPAGAPAGGKAAGATTQQ